MKTDLAQQAINQALSGNWEEAVKTNSKILKEDKNDIDALNRLAKAYAEIGNLKKAILIAKNVIKLDPYNSIALKCINKWKYLKKGDVQRTGATSSDVFIEEPGKTKIVNLTNVSSSIIPKLDCGDEVEINFYGHRVSLTTSDKKYIGRLPDDVGSRLKKLLKIGKKYRVNIKSIDAKEIKVFIREIFSSKEAENIPSFSSERIDYVSFTPPELVHKNTNVIVVEEEED